MGNVKFFQFLRLQFKVTHAFASLLVLLGLVSSCRTSSTEGNSWSTKLQGTPGYYSMPVGHTDANSLQDEQIQSLLAKFKNLYQLTFRDKGLELFFDYNWENPYFGAGSNLIDSQARIMLRGGLIRNNRVTLDGVAFTVNVMII